MTGEGTVANRTPARRRLLAVGVAAAAVMVLPAIGVLVHGVLNASEAGQGLQPAGSGAEVAEMDDEPKRGERRQIDNGVSPDRGSLEPLELIGYDLTREAPGERLFVAMSPDGSMQAVRSADLAPDRICLRLLGETDEESCFEVPEVADLRYLSWSADGRKVAIGEEYNPSNAMAGTGAVTLIDVDAGTSRDPVASVAPTDATIADGTARRHVRPTLDPSGTRLASIVITADGPPVLAITDLATGTERALRLLDPSAWSLRWSPAGHQIWVTNVGGVAASTLTAISLDGSAGPTFDTAVPVPGAEIASHVLVQVSDDGTVGLLMRPSDLIDRGGEGLTYLAVADLETGDVAPVLPIDDGSGTLRHSGGYTGRLAADGRSVVVLYRDGPIPEDGSFPSLRLGRFSVDSVLARNVDPELVVVDLDVVLGIRPPAGQIAELGRARSPFAPLPADGPVLTIPLTASPPVRPDERAAALFQRGSPDFYVHVEVDQNW